MHKRTLFLGLIFGLVVHICNAQISFVGFEQDQCGLITNHGYTYENIPLMCGSHSSGYKIYLDGTEVFEKCIVFGGCSVLEIMFVNETTGFIIESNPNGHTVYKTENSGVDWLSIGGGAPTYLGFYLVNANTGYLVTTWDNPLNLYINRVSDINQSYFSDPNINQDTIINDTIFGESYCPIDYLEFKIQSSGDTIDYKIIFILEPLSIQGIIYDREIGFYPNPSMDFIFFQDTMRIANSEYKIAELSGKVIKTGVVDNNQIYIGDLRVGLYLIRLTKDGREYLGKVIKQ
jgi:Secretion system C-terminal sorting domain